MSEIESIKTLDTQLRVTGVPSGNNKSVRVLTVLFKRFWKVILS